MSTWSGVLFLTLAQAQEKHVWNPSQHFDCFLPRDLPVVWSTISFFSVFKGLSFSRLLQILQLPTLFPPQPSLFPHCSSYTSQSVPVVGFAALLRSCFCSTLFPWWGMARVTRAVRRSRDAGEPWVLTVTQQCPLFVRSSFSNTGKMLLAFWTVLTGAGAFMEQPVSPKISCLLRPSQSTSFLVWNWDFIFFFFYSMYASLYLRGISSAILLPGYLES